MRILDEQALKSVLQMREVIAAVEAGFRAIAAGSTVSPERLRIEMPESEAILLEMPSYMRADKSGEAGLLGTKIVSVFGNNERLGLETIQAIYVLLDAQNGGPAALMDGRLITTMRTAATSATATRHMAAKGRSILAIFGAGVQARAHAFAMVEVAEIERILIVSRNQERAARLSDDLALALALQCSLSTPEEAVRSANLICTCTTSPSPLFDGDWVKAGTHINAVGTFTPSATELDTATIVRARVAIDSWSAAGKEAGEILIPLSEGAISQDHIVGELSDIVCGKISGRASEDQITVFKSSGLAIEDLVTAQLAYQKALQLSAGVEVQL
ncbi:MAG TPA: ornithine cyclodeaminase family protein [Blastocatellia bacterium]|nr:ornithine cyclodeaminase family protein [Blastocatellia bacterium]